MAECSPSYPRIVRTFCSSDSFLRPRPRPFPLARFTLESFFFSNSSFAPRRPRPPLSSLFCPSLRCLPEMPSNCFPYRISMKYTRNVTDSPSPAPPPATSSTPAPNFSIKNSGAWRDGAGRGGASIRDARAGNRRIKTFSYFARNRRRKA